jgi:hypothetical protein
MNLELKNAIFNEKEMYFLSNRFIRSHSLSIEELGLLANACRVNSLSMVYAAGSGHLGTSFTLRCSMQ